MFVPPAFACRPLSWLGIAGTLEFGVLGYLPFYRASPIAPAFSSGLSPIHMGSPIITFPGPPLVHCDVSCLITFHKQLSLLSSR